MKKIIIFLSVVCLITTLFTISAFAEDVAPVADYTIKAGVYEMVENPTQYKFNYNFAIKFTVLNDPDPFKPGENTEYWGFKKNSTHWGPFADSNAIIRPWVDNSTLEPLYDGIKIQVTNDTTVADYYYEWFNSNFITPGQRTECDATECPVGDANHDNYCDDCGLPMVYNLRSTLLDYAQSEIDRALTGSIPSGQYWLIVKAAPSYPGGPDSYYMYISAEKFYLDGNTLLAGTGNALVHRALVSQDSDGDFTASGWSSAQTGSHILVVSDVVDSSHGTSFFFPIPLWWEMEAVGEQALTEQAVPKVVSAMKIVTACSVGLLALVIALILLSTKFRRFLP